MPIFTRPVKPPGLSEEAALSVTVNVVVSQRALNRALAVFAAMLVPLGTGTVCDQQIIATHSPVSTSAAK
jgi:hypothetical protein